MRRLVFVLGLVAALLLIGVLLLSRFMGAHWNLLLVLGMIGLPVRLIALIRDIRSKRIRWPRGWSAEERPSHIAHGLIQTIGALVGILAVSMAVIPAQMGSDLASFYVFLVGLLLGWVAMAWLPQESPRWGLSLMMLVIGLVFGVDLVREAGEPEPLVTGLLSPIAADSDVMHGGVTPLLNHHFSLQQQRHALDIIINRNGLFADGPLESLESYGCWGVSIRAPADGVVVRSVDELPDNPIGTMDPENLAGNYLVLEIAPEQFLLMAHLQAGSIAALTGDRVKAGQPVARCGNSGNTSAPHLHLQIMNRPDFSNTDPDLSTFPMSFVAVECGGSIAARVPRRNDRLIAAP